MSKKMQDKQPLLEKQRDNPLRRVVDATHGDVGYEAYNVLPLTTDLEFAHVDNIKYRPKHGVLRKMGKGLYIVGVPIVSWIHALLKTRMIPEGSIGISTNNGKPEFLSPGWHFCASPLRSINRVIPLSGDEPIINMTKGIVTIKDGYVGIAQDQGKYLLLGPGMHQWESATFRFIESKRLASNVVPLGPYTLITVPPGEVAVTEDNGALRILDINSETGQRTHFLRHAKWTFKGMLSTQVQFDKLEAESILTADRVEVDLDSTVCWLIKDPHKAALHGGHDMETIRSVVQRAARATVADMVSVRKISDRSMGGKASRRDPTRTAVMAEGEESQHATHHQLETCNHEVAEIGVVLTQIAIVQIKIHHEDTRREIAKIAAIPAKTKEMREVAEASAENEVVAAQAQARARLEGARAEAAARLEIATAEAKSIQLLAEAQRRAGELLGQPHTTAATLARIELTGKALSQANASVFFIPPGQTEHLLANPAIINMANSNNGNNNNNNGNGSGVQAEVPEASDN